MNAPPSEPVTAGIKVALCHSGGDRESAPQAVVELARALAGRGHEVTVLTSVVGARSVSSGDGVRVIRRRRPRSLHVLRNYENLIEAAPGFAYELARERFDILHTFHPIDAWTAVVAERLTGHAPVVVSLERSPERRHLVSRRYRLEMLSRSAREASAVTVTSEAAAVAVRRYLLRDPIVVPSPPQVTCEAAAERYEDVYSRSLADAGAIRT
jgi:glycosyltransferase involved in cell wall biosynthesis